MLLKEGGLPVIEQETGEKVLTLFRIGTNHDCDICWGNIEKLLIYFRRQPKELFMLIEEGRQG